MASARWILPFTASLGLMAATDAVEEHNGQLFLISHHPEIVNQWAPGNGVEFFRDAGGAVRTRRFPGETQSSLSPAELIARGWEHA